MRMSKLLTKTRREAPTDEVSKNAGLLIRGGFIHKEAAGVYSYLPLGLLVLKKIETIIREEMERIGGQEVLLSTLQDPSIWEKTGRWDDAVVDNWFKTKLKDGALMGLGFSHEEPLVRIMAQHISSYRDLPVAVFQIQNKFRNELRAKSGIFRGREFLMKDMYAFVRTEADLDRFHETCAEAYSKIFDRVGIGARIFRTFASGGSFSRFSDEFQMLTSAGEDTIYVDRKRNVAVNKEVYSDDVLKDLGLKKDELEETRAIEVANIFKLGTRFSEPLGLTYKGETGKVEPVYMGCYGMGLTRLMGALVEVSSDERGIIWPKAVAPYRAHLISLGGGDAARKYADELYVRLRESGIEVLYDDRDANTGVKFKDAELIGIPIVGIVSDRNIAQGMVEAKERASGEAKLVSPDEFINLCME